MAAGARPVTLDDLRAHLDVRGIARQKWPEELRIVEDFSRTASGKVRKVDLRTWLREESGER
jgi:non-ribosomal peptide synthetase component E (peptide arylation enzyme)